MLGQPTIGEVPTGVSGPRAAGRADRCMNVLQYGAAILAIVVVALLAVVR